MKEPTKQDVLDIAEYLGCNGEELWSEISKLLLQQHKYSYTQGFNSALNTKELLT